MSAASPAKDAEKGITVNIYKHLYEKLKKRGYEIKGYVNDAVEKDLCSIEFREKLKPYLRFVSSEGKSIYIKDDKINQVVEVQAAIREQGRPELRCLHDETDGCVHVAYCLNCGEVARALANHSVF